MEVNAIKINIFEADALYHVTLQTSCTSAPVLSDRTSPHCFPDAATLSCPFALRVADGAVANPGEPALGHQPL